MVRGRRRKLVKTTSTTSSSRSRMRGGTAAEYYRMNGKGKKKKRSGGKGKGSKQCDNTITVCGADDCIQQFTYSEATMTNVLEIEWCFNARSPIERTYDIDGMTIIMEESISLMSYLQIADQNGCRDIISGSNLALLGFRWNCGFWEAGCGYTANWMRDSLLGLFVEFVPLQGTGFARYHFTGQECCTDWTAGHLVVQDFEMEEFVLEEGDCPFVRDDTRGTYKMRLSWRHNLVGDDYAARSAGGTQFPPIAQTICSSSADCPNLATPFIRAPTGCSAPPASPGCPMLDGTFDWTSLTIGPYFSVPADGYTRTNCGQAQESITDGLKMGVDRSRPRGDDEGGRTLTWYIQTDKIVNPENDPLCCSTSSDLQAAPYNFAGCNSPSYCRLDWN